MSSKPRSTRSRVANALTRSLPLAVALALTAACTTTSERSAGVDAADVARVELYFYAFSERPTDVTRTTVTNPGVIAELVSAFTDMPVTASDRDPADLAEHQATGVRYVLEDGRVVELTQVFIAHQDVVVVWADKTVSDTTWGVPLADYYRDMEVNETTTEVDPAEVPVAFAP